jgi:membrane-associated protein
MDQLTQFLYDAAVSPIAYLILGGLIIGDAVLPLLPSESLVVGLASVLVHEQAAFLLVLWVVSFAAAWIGDNIAYAIGQTKLLSDNRFTRQPQVRAVFDWSREMLEKRGSTIIVVGRFIPVARIAINMMSGAVRFGRGRFMGIVVISSGLWATYNVLIGAFAGHWFQEHPLLGMVVAIGLGMILGPVVDWILRKTVLRGTESAKAAQRRAAASEDPAEDSAEDPAEDPADEPAATTGADVRTMPDTGSGVPGPGATATSP